MFVFKSKLNKLCPALLYMTIWKGDLSSGI